MKPGPELGERLRAEAQRLDVEDPSFAVIARRGRRRTRLRTGAIAMSILAFAAVSVGLGLRVTQEDDPVLEARAQRPVEVPAFTGDDLQEDEDQYSYEISEEPAAPPPRAQKGEFAGASGAGSAGATDDLIGEQQGSAGPGSGGQGTTPSASVAGGPAVGGSPASPHVIKTARLRLEVRENSLSGTFAEVERLAGRHGGFVSDSFTRSDPARSGELTIRIPAAVFESVVAELKSLGRVEAQRISGVDVTADFVDLQARLRNWEAQERVLVRLMGEANTINESLQVQRELQGVRVEIERIQGQLRVLRDQTELASISLSIHEPGAAEEPPSERSAWDRAVTAASEVLAAMLVGLGYLLPILAALLILWLGARAVRSRRTD